MDESACMYPIVDVYPIAIAGNFPIMHWAAFPDSRSREMKFTEPPQIPITSHTFTVKYL